MNTTGVLCIALALLASASGQYRMYNAAIYAVRMVEETTTATPTTTIPTTTTPTTTTPTTTTPTTTTPTTTTPTTTTPTTTTPTTTTPTTTTPTTTTPTTTTTTTTTPTPTSVKSVVHVRNARSVRAQVEVTTHECSGTVIGNNDVITTASCVKRIEAMPGFKKIVIGTAQNANANPEATPAPKYYDVKGTHVHGSYDAVNKKNNIAILKLWNLIDMSDNIVRDIFWLISKPKVDTNCMFAFWNQNALQTSANATIETCTPANDDRVCAKGFTAATTCPAGFEGASLVCDDRLAGVFSVDATTSCNGVSRSFHDIAKSEKWVWEIVSGVPTLGVSVLSLAAVLIAVVSSL